MGPAQAPGCTCGPLGHCTDLKRSAPIRWLQLLTKLLEGGLLADEMSPRHPHAPSEVCASWMGLCRPPEAPCFRRIDVKASHCAERGRSHLSSPRECAALPWLGVGAEVHGAVFWLPRRVPWVQCSARHS